MIGNALLLALRLVHDQAILCRRDLSLVVHSLFDGNCDPPSDDEGLDALIGGVLGDEAGDLIPLPMVEGAIDGNAEDVFDDLGDDQLFNGDDFGLAEEYVIGWIGCVRGGQRDAASQRRR